MFSPTIYLIIGALLGGYWCAFMQGAPLTPGDYFRQITDADTNMLGGISKTVSDTDGLIRGLKRHWLLRSAFKNKKSETNNVPR